METVMYVEGMTCKHCKMRVEKGLGGVSGVKTVTIDLTTGKTVVELKKTLDTQVLIDAVKEAGYRVSKVE
ncbi:MAG: heavy metal-associated domain-containing protein [Candidatus Izemoplasmatales bacterium]|jgi:copper ion binding protein|nr:heavy metal-associated domain-containing protein [Candidatus Izemoplasmatales bacterium]